MWQRPIAQAAIMRQVLYHPGVAAAIARLHAQWFPLNASIMMNPSQIQTAMTVMIMMMIMMAMIMTMMNPQQPLQLLQEVSTCNSAALFSLGLCCWHSVVSSIPESLKPTRKPSKFEEAWLAIWFSQASLRLS
jgi:hypothetical protein